MPSQKRAVDSTPVPRLVPLPREQYLRKEETRIRSLALPQAANADPQVQVHLFAVCAAEELIDIHEAAALRQEAQGAPHFARSHRRYATLAWQLKLFHLNQLAALLI